MLRVGHLDVEKQEVCDWDVCHAGTEASDDQGRDRTWSGD